MAESDRNAYLASLRLKIAEKYYFSDAILSRLAEELAPVYSESIGNES